MVLINLLLPQDVYDFYSKIANLAQLPLERVLTDSLFKLAGELSLEALYNKQISD